LLFSADSGGFSVWLVMLVGLVFPSFGFIDVGVFGAFE
jgi:hypothetical protein